MPIDKIERTIELPFPPERVWQAVTSPGELCCWFSDEAIFTPTVGSELRLIWHGLGSASGRIEQVEPPHRFSFRWRARGVPDSEPMTALNSTLVTFWLEKTAVGTRLHVTEAGFAALPPALRQPTLRANESGWTAELADLAAWFAGVAV